MPAKIPAEFRPAFSLEFHLKDTQEFCRNSSGIPAIIPVDYIRIPGWNSGQVCTRIPAGFHQNSRSIFTRDVLSVRVQDCNPDLSSVHAFVAKFPVLGRIVPHGQQRAFRNKYILGQSHDFWRAYSLFVARVASFAPEREAQGRK